MDQARDTNRQRALRHAAPERVRELLKTYRRRAAVHPTRTGEGTGPRAPRRNGSAR